MKKLENSIEGSTVLITGGTGSFGYQMTQRLLKIPDVHVIVYSRDEDKQRVMQNYFSNCHLSFVLGDVRDYNRLEDSLNGVDIVMHAGALKQIPSVEYNPMEAIKTNTTSAYNILKASDRQNVEKVIAISTDKACQPVNSYGASKFLMEKIITGDEIWTDTTKTCCVRYGNVLGSRGSVLPVWDKLLEENKPIPITDYQMRRFFLTLDQATELILYACHNMDGKEIFVRKAPALYIKDLAEVYCELKTGKKPKLKEIGVRSGEKLDETLIAREEIHRSKKIHKDYIKIMRHDYTKPLDDLKEEYSSATTEQLDHAKIKKLIEGINWIK